MDVSLILTHRCNFDCGYCYAGEHHKADIEEQVLRRGVDLLFADDCRSAQLSFFGGEPFLAFEAMRRATALAEARAEEEGRELRLQCTTNGSLIGEEELAFVLAHDLHVTVSIDGVREAHDLNRPCAGGKPSFDRVLAGLRALIDGGAKVDAMMVVTPATAQHLYLSANFLWGEGVRTVRANLALDETWGPSERAELREQLVSIGWEQVARRMRGEAVTFEQFEAGIREFHERAEPRLARRGAARAKRPRVVVGTSGHLYACAPMVGEDRDDGPEAALRLGHIRMAPEAIQAAVSSGGVACESGKGCQCAAYLETGDRYTAGRMGRWYGAVCREVGQTIAESLTRHDQAAAKSTSKAPRRRRFIAGIAAIAGAAAVGAPLVGGLWTDDELPRPCRLQSRKQGLPASELPEYPLAGAVAVPEELPPPPPRREVIVSGGLAPPDE